MKNLKPTLSKTVAVSVVIAVGILGLSAIFSASAQTQLPAPSQATSENAPPSSSTTTTTTIPNDRAAYQAQQAAIQCDPQDHHWPAYVVGEGGILEQDLGGIYRADLRWSGKQDTRIIYYRWQIHGFFGNSWQLRVAHADSTRTLSEGTIISMYCTEAADQTRLDNLNLLHGHTEVSLHGGNNVIVAPETITRPDDMRSSFLFNELLWDCQASPVSAGIWSLQIRNLETGRWSYSNPCYSDIETRVLTQDDYDAVTTIHQGDIIYVSYLRCDACGFHTDYAIYWNAGSREFQKVVPHVEDTGDDDATNGDAADADATEGDNPADPT